MAVPKPREFQKGKKVVFINLSNEEQALLEKAKLRQSKYRLKLLTLLTSRSSWVLNRTGSVYLIPRNTDGDAESEKRLPPHIVSLAIYFGYMVFIRTDTIARTDLGASFYKVNKHRINPHII